MRIAINTLAVTSERGRVLTYLVEMMAALERIDSGDEFLLVVGQQHRHPFGPFAGRGKVRIEEVWLPRAWRSLRILQEQASIPKIVSRWGADVLLCPEGVASLRSACPQVVVMHDALWQVVLDGLPFARRQYLEWIIPRSLRKAKRVITVSKTACLHLVERGLLDLEKADVVPLGVNRLAMFERPAPDGILERLGSGYYLFVGDLYTYKGVHRIFDAMALLQRNFGLDRDLVVVGSDPWGHRRHLESRVHELGLENRVHFLGGVDHGRLGWIYERAFCLVHPSEVEASPMPVLEAMVCGTPVVASNRTAMPEVTGDAGIIVGIESAGEMIWALRRMEEPSVRARFVELGRARAAQFTWDDVAARTLGVLRCAAGVAPAQPARTVARRVGAET